MKELTKLKINGTTLYVYEELGNVIKQIACKYSYCDVISKDINNGLYGVWPDKLTIFSKIKHFFKDSNDKFLGFYLVPEQTICLLVPKVTKHTKLLVNVLAHEYQHAAFRINKKALYYMLPFIHNWYVEFVRKITNDNYSAVKIFEDKLVNLLVNNELHNNVITIRNNAINIWKIGAKYANELAMVVSFLENAKYYKTIFKFIYLTYVDMLGRSLKTLKILDTILFGQELTIPSEIYCIKASVSPYDKTVMNIIGSTKLRGFSNA